MTAHHYPSDLTDDRWTLIEPHTLAVPTVRRPRKTDMRDVVPPRPRSRPTRSGANRVEIDRWRRAG